MNDVSAADSIVLWGKLTVPSAVTHAAAVRISDADAREELRRLIRAHDHRDFGVRGVGLTELLRELSLRHGLVVELQGAVRRDGDSGERLHARVAVRSLRKIDVHAL